MQAFVQLICDCGWVLEENESGVYRCTNPQCANRMKLYRITVNTEPVVASVIKQ